MQKEENKIINNDSRTALDTCLIYPIENLERSYLEERCKKYFNDKQLKIILQELQGNLREFFVIESTKTGKIIGYTLSKKYEKRDNCVEICIMFLNDEIKERMSEEILSFQINHLMMDKSVHYICLKVLNKDKELSSTAEKIGFLKDGIFISNQFIQDEFSYCTIYKYKLI